MMTYRLNQQRGWMSEGFRKKELGQKETDTSLATKNQ